MIILKYRVTRSQAVKRGWPTCGLVELEIEPEEIPAELRPILASGLVYDRDRGLTDLIDNEICLPSLDQVGLISELHRLAAEKQLAAAREEAAATKAVAARTEFLAVLRARPLNSLATDLFAARQGSRSAPWVVPDLDCYRPEREISAEALGEPLTSQVRDLATLLQAEADQKKADQKAALLRAKAEKEARAAAEAEALQTWAVTAGSDLLRARIQEGFVWKPLARQEFAATRCSALCAAVPELRELRESDNLTLGEAADRTTPTLAEIRILRAAKKALPEAVCNLRWVKYTSEDGEKFARTELRVIVTVPDGNLVTQSFGFESASDTRHKATVTAD